MNNPKRLIRLINVPRGLGGITARTMQPIMNTTK
jgi:hypothetical protein